MNTNTVEKWQPIGSEQFAAACRVCGAVRDEKNNPCYHCKREQKSGFVFDPNKYIVLYRELTKRRYWISDDLRPVCIDPTYESEELKAVKKDRDFWKGLADKAMQSIMSIAERMADSK